MTIRHGLISKAGFLLFKQSYDSVPPLRQQSAVASRTAQSGRQIHRNQNAVCASRNVPPDILVICGKKTNEDVKEDISIAKRAKVIPTTLEGVLACQ